MPEIIEHFDGAADKQFRVIDDTGFVAELSFTYRLWLASFGDGICPRWAGMVLQCRIGTDLWEDVIV